MHRTVAQVLARFDEAIGIDRVPAGGRPAVPKATSPVRAGERSSVERVAVPAPAAESAPSVRVPALELPTALLQPAPADRDERLARLLAIEARHAAACPHCTTITGHRNLVFGEGSPDAEVMFVGEAPGEVEDEEGRPFVGPAGQKLDEMIRAMGFRREEVYVTNVLKARPPGKRTPLPEELARCGPFLLEQVLAIRPRVIVTLGGPATKLLCGTDLGITRLRGTWQSWQPPEGSDCGPIPVMPTYHPSYVLSNYTPKVRGEVWSDLKRVLERLGRMPGAASASGS